MGKRWNLILHVKLWGDSWGTDESAASSFTSQFQAILPTASERTALVTGQPDPNHLASLFDQIEEETQPKSVTQFILQVLLNCKVVFVRTGEMEATEGRGIFKKRVKVLLHRGPIFWGHWGSGELWEACLEEGEEREANVAF